MCSGLTFFTLSVSAPIHLLLQRDPAANPPQRTSPGTSSLSPKDDLERLTCGGVSSRHSAQCGMELQGKNVA